MSIAVDFVGTPLSGEEPLSVEFSLTVVSSSAGIRRRVRVRRADFSTQEGYELALKAAASEAGLTYIPSKEPHVQKPNRKRISTVPVDKSLSIDSEIMSVQETERKRKRKEEQEDLELLVSMVKVIDEAWTSSAF